jgi:NTE family protein
VAFEVHGRSRNGDRGAQATPETTERPSRRPTIGLALGGGGARGFAHIGVIRALALHGIVPDIIVGTSIGSVVGGCFAAGQLDTLADWCSSLTKRGILSYLDISLAGSGLIGGGRLASKLEAGLGDTLIENLPIRFATIATEIRTGHEVWLTRGRLSDAMRASYALPGIFPPVGLDGRWLVDGALVNPVPVSAARVLGARLVIAVNLSSDILGRGITMGGESTTPAETVLHETANERHGLRRIFGAEHSLRRQFVGGGRRPGIPTVMVDAFNIMQDRITRARLAGDPPDVTINPRVGTVGWFDFHRSQEAIDVGARAAERAIEDIAEAIAALSSPSAPPAPDVK